MFSLPVPKDFKPTDQYVWTIVANGQAMSIPLRLKADYVMSPFKEIAVGNTPPVIRFEQNGKTLQGPISNLASAPARTASLGTPFSLAALDHGRHEIHERYQRADDAAAPAGHAAVVEISRSRCGDVRQGDAGGRETRVR
jgi:hypothetical protein